MTITIVAVSWPGGGTLKLTCGPRVEVGSERPSIVGHRGSRQREESADGLLECGGPFDVAGPLGSGVAQGLRKNHLVQRANVPLQLVDGLGVCAPGVLGGPGPRRAAARVRECSTDRVRVSTAEPHRTSPAEMAVSSVAWNAATGNESPATVVRYSVRRPSRAR